MIRINLLPHREEKRRERKNAFVRASVLSAATGFTIALAIYGFFATQIADQAQRNDFIKAENQKLDTQIAEIATLKREIEGLKARQQAVEDLQSDRNQPVYLMDELVKQVPEGIYLRDFKQENQRVVIHGYAQSNERVSEFLRNVGNHSAWLERPDLVEIRATGIGQGRDAKKVFEFTVNVGIRRPRDQEQQATGPGTGAAPGAAQKL